MNACIKSASPRIGAIIILSTVVGIGFSTKQGEASAKTTAPASVGGDHTTETLTKEIDDLVAHGEKIDASHLHVDLVDRQGALHFSVDFALGGEQDETLKWTLPDAPATTGGIQMRIDHLPSLESAITVAQLVHTNVTNAVSGQDYDNWGCDKVMGIELVDSYGRNGACCDAHDACYAANKCKAESWAPFVGSKECDRCNDQILYCVANVHPGPSICVKLGNCGQPR